MRMKLMVVVAVAVGMMAPVDSAFAETTVRGGDAAQSVSKSVPKGWMEDFEAARRQAAKEGKLILMNFSGSDWCGWCKKMDSEVFSQERFVKEASKKYVLVMIDSPKDSSILSELAQKQNAVLKMRYGVRGFPSVVIVNPDGEVVARHSGYRQGGPNGYKKYLKDLTKGVKWPAKGQVVKPLESLATDVGTSRTEGDGDEPAFELRSGRVVFTGPKSMEADIRGTKERYEKILPFVRSIYGNEVAADGPFVVRFRKRNGAGYVPGLEGWELNSDSNGSCGWFWKRNGTSIYYMACCVHNGPREPNWAFIAFYLDYFIREAAGELKSAQSMIDATLQGKSRDSKASWMKARLPHWAVFRELFKDAPNAFREYYKEKRRLFDSGTIGHKLTLSDEAAIFSKIAGVDAFPVFTAHGLEVNPADTKIAAGHVKSRANAATCDKKGSCKAPVAQSAMQSAWLTDCGEAQRMARTAGKLMLVYNHTPGDMFRLQGFHSDSDFLAYATNRFVLVSIDGWGTDKKGAYPWAYSSGWPSCRILDADGNPAADGKDRFGMWRLGNSDYFYASGGQMLELLKGFEIARLVLTGVLPEKGKNPNPDELAKLHDAMAVLPETFVNWKYLKFAEMLVAADPDGSRGYRGCYPYAAEVYPKIKGYEQLKRNFYSTLYRQVEARIAAEGGDRSGWSRNTAIVYGELAGEWEPKIADAVEKLDAIDADIPNGDSRFQFEIIKKAMGELLRRLRTKR